MYIKEVNEIYQAGGITRDQFDALAIAIGTALTELANTGHSISAFGEGVDGELYVVNYGGTIHQIIP